MKNDLKNIEKIYKIVKEYNGQNPYIINLKNHVFVFKTKQLNDFEMEYVMKNHEKEPKKIDKIVIIAEWYGKKLQTKFEIEFIPQKL